MSIMRGRVDVDLWLWSVDYTKLYHEKKKKKAIVENFALGFWFVLFNLVSWKFGLLGKNGFEPAGWKWTLFAHVVKYGY